MCKSRNYNWQTDDYIIIVIVSQVKSSQSSQQIFERLPANYVSLKSSRHLVIYNSFLYSQVCKNDQLCHCEGGFDPKDGCASGVTDIFIWIITRTTCAQSPRGWPSGISIFLGGDSWAVKSSWVGTKKEGILMCDFLFQLTSSFITALGFYLRLQAAKTSIDIENYWH